MSSLSVKLPITRNTIDGFAMIKDFQTLVKQATVFLPVVNILEINFDTSDPDNNVLGIKILYNLPDVGITDLLEFTI